MRQDHRNGDLVRGYCGTARGVRARGKWASLKRGAEHPLVSVLCLDHANVSIPVELGPCSTGLKKSILGRMR